MAEDDLQAWMFIEEAAADQPQRMYRRFRGEGPGRPEQPSVTFIERRGYRRRPRVQIERNVECFDRAPERPILRQIVMQHARRLIRLRVAIHQRAFESEFLDATFEFSRRELRLLHRQGCYADEPVRTLCDFPREDVIGLAG